MTSVNYATIIKRYVQDRNTLDTFIQKRHDYAQRILNANSRNQLRQIENDLAQYMPLLHKWNSFPQEYECLKDKLDELRLFKKALAEQKGILNNRFAAHEHLMRLAEKYGIPNEAKEEPQQIYMPTREEITHIPQNHSKLERIVKSEPVPNENITLSTLLSYYKKSGLVGEENIAILQTLGAINKLCFGIESLSGSGKSYTTDLLIDLLPESSVYKMELSSNTAEMYQAQTINKAQIIYIPELQKAMKSSPIVVEILKNVTEGKDASRQVRDVSTKSNKKYTIKGDKGVLFTLAIENEFKYDAEFARRVFILHTDISADQTDNILKYKASRRHANHSYQQKDLVQLRYQLQKHIEDCLSYSDIDYENPFAEYISEFIPRTIRARSYDDYFFDLIEASSKFYHNNRIKDDGILFVNLEDIYTIHQLYWKQFVKTLLKIPLLGELALAIFNSHSHESLTAEDIYIQLRKQNSSINYTVVNDTLERLVDAGLLEKDDYKVRKPIYLKVQEIPNFEKQIDWQKCFEQGLHFMEENYKDLTHKWIISQTQGNSIVAKDPVENKDIILVKDYQPFINGDGIG